MLKYFGSKDVRQNYLSFKAGIRMKVYPFSE